MDPVIGGTVLAGGLSLVNSLLNSGSIDKANRYNLQVVRETNEANAAIHRADNEFNRQMAFDMFNAENAYNTPLQQKLRLEQAGFNPAVAMGEGAVSAGSADGSTPSAASPLPMVAPQVQPVPSPFSTVFDQLGKAASAFATMKQGKLSGAEEKFVLTQAQSELLRQESLKMDNSIKAAYGMKTADQQWQNLVKQFEKMDKEINTLIEQGNFYKAESLLKDMQKQKLSHEDQLLQDTYDTLIEQEKQKLTNLQKTGQLIDEQKETQKHQQNYLDASASNQAAQAGEANARKNLTTEQYEQLKAMHEDNVVINRLIREGKDLDVNKLYQTFDAQVRMLLNAGLISDEQAKRAHEDAEIAKKQNTMYYWDSAFNKLERTAKAVAGFIPFASGGAGSSGSMYTPMWSNASSTY